MDYILLGRELDKEARNNGYTNCPDELIQLIVDYTGNIKDKPTGFFLIQIHYNYDSYYHRFILENGYRKDKWEFLGNRSTFSTPIYFCAVCNRKYTNKGKNHRKTPKHIRNLGLDIYHDWGEIYQENHIKGISKNYRRNIKFNPEKLHFREMWD